MPFFVQSTVLVVAFYIYITYTFNKSQEGMMNIFLTVLVALFLGAYYIFTAPSVRTPDQETEYAVKYADLRAIIECTAAVHNANINGTQFQDVCITQNGIQSDIVCLDRRMSLTDCSGASTYNYVVTTSGTIPNTQFNNTMTILEKNFADAGSFGIFQNGYVISGATVTKRAIPKSLISHMNMHDGQLVYVTQFAKTDPAATFTSPGIDDVVCPPETSKVLRFGRWQCVGYNTKTSCAGDTIYDYSTDSCIPDDSLKPLCGSVQTAVLVDGIWECVDPFPDRKCDGNTTAKLNYTTMTWECIVDPNKTAKKTKCSHFKTSVTPGRGKASMRVDQLTCTDCEKMLVDEETCVAHCVPDTSKLTSESCYPGEATDCADETHGLYFGFPNVNYAKKVSELEGHTVIFDASHSQNRKFNCMDCGERGVDLENSFPPYTIICN